MNSVIYMQYLMASPFMPVITMWNTTGRARDDGFEQNCKILWWIHTHNGVFNQSIWKWFHFDFSNKRKMHFSILFNTKSGTGACVGAGNIEIGYLFLQQQQQQKKYQFWQENSFYFRFICLVWCWHSDLELCVVILCCFFSLCLSFVHYDCLFL